MGVAGQECQGMGYSGKMKQERAVLECSIEKGMQHGQKITLRGEADQLPGTVPGDVVFVLACQKHDRFHRKGDDLLIEQKISLVEALCGANIVFKHLDGRTLVARTKVSPAPLLPSPSPPCFPQLLSLVRTWYSPSLHSFLPSSSLLPPDVSSPSLALALCLRSRPPSAAPHSPER
jgi:hypothetical protein